MNLAHMHLLLNHISVVGLPVGLIFLVYGLVKKNTHVQRFSLIVLIALAAFIIPAYLTGEPAEELVENIPGVTKSLIHAHEEAAEASLSLTLFTAGLAAVALWAHRKEKLTRQASLAVVVIAIMATLSIAYTCSLGGQIRHSELRTSPINFEESTHQE